MSTQIKEKPILMSTEMVRAILEGKKFQTRRVVKPQPFGVGSRLWVRETFKYIDFDLRDMGELHPNVKIEYKADGLQRWVKGDYKTQISIPVPPNEIWRPSIFMPRWASRITLEITELRAQPVQDISEEDAIAEGIANGAYAVNPRYSFQVLWDSINKKRGYSWESNCWVWAISFKRVS